MEVYRVSLRSPLNSSRVVDMYKVGILFEVDTTVRKLAEGSLLLDFGGLNSVLERNKILASNCNGSGKRKSKEAENVAK